MRGHGLDGLVERPASGIRIRKDVTVRWSGLIKEVSQSALPRMRNPIITAASAAEVGSRSARPFVAAHELCFR